MNNFPMIYVDAAATALKSDSVMAAEMDFVQNHYANAGRGSCARAAYADDMVARARAAAAEFVGAASPDQIIFTSGATDGLNRLARMIAGDRRIIVSDLDHHSARLPFQEGRRMKDEGRSIIVCPLTSDLNLDVSRVPAGDVFVITAMSNVTGAAQDVGALVAAANGALTIVDCAQYAAHAKMDVTAWGCDAAVFSAHKVGGATGLGILYLKNPDDWSPDIFGGGAYMATGPARFEAGTLPLMQLAGLPVALTESIENRVKSIMLAQRFRERLGENPKIKWISPADSSVQSFYVPDMHAIDIGALAGARGVCLRAGNMCAKWIFEYLGISGAVRVSPGPWNTMDDMDRVADVLNEIIKK